MVALNNSNQRQHFAVAHLSQVTQHKQSVMESRCHVVVLLLSLLLSAASTDAAFKKVDNLLYYVHREPQSFASAMRFCQSMGGRPPYD